MVKVLVVDDSDVSLFVLENWLRRGGYDVYTAKNGLAALERLATEPLDLIISDALMPEMDGFEFCFRVKSSPLTQHIPFIFCSADYISPLDEQFAMKLGASSYVVKGDDPVAFIRDLERGVAATEQKPAAAALGFPEEVYLREYTARLIGKLDEKVRALEHSNKQLEAKNAQLREADRLKDDFLAVVSHELRTPLTAIIGFNELVHNGTAGPLTAEQAEFLGIALARGEDLRRLIEELMDLNHMRAGKCTVAPGLVVLRDVVRAATESVQPSGEKRGLRLELRLSEPATVLHADPDALRRVLIILLDNAIKFTPAGGSITLSAAATREAVVFQVRDTGIGIPQDGLTVIFDSFRQLEQHHNRQFEGLGLGLAIAKHLVELHGGRIWAESEEGRGSTFTVTLPPAAAGAGTPHPDAHAGPLAPWPPEQVPVAV